MRYLECVYKAGRGKQRETHEGRDGREISLCLRRRWHRGKSFSIDSLLFFVFSLFATGHVVLAGSFSISFFFFFFGEQFEKLVEINWICALAKV